MTPMGPIKDKVKGLTTDWHGGT